MEEFNVYEKGLKELAAELWSKWFKSQILNLLPPEMKSIMYFDADIVARKPLAQGWLHDVAQLIANQHCDFATYPERLRLWFPIIRPKKDCPLCGKFYGAILLLKRGQSDSLLNKWGDLMVHAPIEGRDQRKLTVAIESTKANVRWQPSRWKHFQTKKDVIAKVWFRLRGPPTFFHLGSAKNYTQTKPCKYIKPQFEAISTNV